jgi:hypothetical protein
MEKNMFGNYQSESLKELGLALAKAQGDMAMAGMHADNPFFKSKYATFSMLVKASRPSLSKNGLSVIQRVVNENDIPFLGTMLLHASGEWIESRIKIAPIKTDPQSLGSCLSYLKRYAYTALVGVICDDEDDDAESAMKEYRAPRTEYKQVNDELISEDQYNDLFYQLSGFPEILVQVLEGLRIRDLREMPRERYRKSLNRILELKAAKVKPQ